jgi:exodeoxyribonuclease VII small subunit
MTDNTQADVKKLTFERAIEELESIVKRLRTARCRWRSRLPIYERGEALKRRCEELLRQAEARVDKITDGCKRQGHRTEPLDVQSEA